MDNNQNNINNVNNSNGVNPNTTNNNTVSPSGVNSVSNNYSANPSIVNSNPTTNYNNNNYGTSPSSNVNSNTEILGVSPNVVTPSSSQVTQSGPVGVNEVSTATVQPVPTEVNNGVNPASQSVPTNITNNIPINTPNNNVEVLDGKANNSSTVDKNMKEVEINYTPPSKFKVFLLIAFFAFLIIFVIFLPEINSFMETYKASKEAEAPKIITTGRLICTLKRSTNNLDISYENIFHFTDSKLNSLNYTVTTRGDATLDEVTLDEEQNKCNHLKESTELLRGVNITCEYKQGQQDTIQNFTFSDLSLEEMDAAFSEAGGVVPEFENEENIDDIERNMNASGYTCERRSN